MGRRRSSEPKEKRRKRVTVQLLQREHAGKVTEPYRIMEDLLATEHGHLRDLPIAIAWRLGWRPDADGHLRLGQLKKRGDLDRELDSFDFIILLNKEAWSGLNDKQKRALIDHELSHGQIVMDSDGEVKLDDRGRSCLRVRKHDIEEFQSVIDRHGFYTSTLSEVAKAAIADARRPLLAGLDDGDEEGGNGEANGEAEAKAGAKKPATNPDGWKRRPITDLGIGARLVAAMADREKPIKTLGQLSKHMEAGGDWWHREIKGIGDTARAYIEAAFTRFWAEHPEYCQKQPQPA